MTPNRGYIPKSCRRHGYDRNKKCHYCYRSQLIGNNTMIGMSKEQYLLYVIFGLDNGRFFQRRPPKKRRKASRGPSS